MAAGARPSVFLVGRPAAQWAPDTGAGGVEGLVPIWLAIRNSAQRDYLRPEAIKAGLKPLGWHALRHSYRTWLGEKGTGPEVQKELMRHSTIAMCWAVTVVEFRMRIGRRIPGWSAICCSSEIRYWTVNGLWRLVTD
jgi:hypothetical protein